MKRWTIWMILGVFVFSSLLCTTLPAPVLAATSYTVDTAPTVVEDGPRKMGRVVIKGTSKQAFMGGDRAEFRLPADFYFTNYAVGSQNGSDIEVVVQQGFSSPETAVELTPISDAYINDHYIGFKLEIKERSGADDKEPEITIFFNRIYVPVGATRGNVTLSVEAEENSGFTSTSLVIGKVEEAQLSLKVDRTPLPSLLADSRVGPIVINENVGGAFEYLELSLPPGYKWDASQTVITPGLGLENDYDKDGVEERAYIFKIIKDKYGRSVLRITFDPVKNRPSETKGKLTIDSFVTLEKGSATYGDVNVAVTGSTNPTPTTLRIGSYSEQKVTVSAGTPKKLYGGMLNQDLADITIAENAPGSLIANRRTVDIELPDGAKWASEPVVKVEGTTELSLGLQGGRTFTQGNEGRTVTFYVNNPSDKRAGRVVIKEAKVNLAVDAIGDLTVKVYDTSGKAHEVSVGNIISPVSVISSPPNLLRGQQNQVAGDIEIREGTSCCLLARELWLDFPHGVFLEETPAVQVTAGDLKIGTVQLATDRSTERLIIPIETSSTTVSTLRVTGIKYRISNSIADGDLEVLIGGPAANEVNYGVKPALFPSTEWVTRVVNGKVVSDVQADPPPVLANKQTLVFKIGESNYQVNGVNHAMDVAPFIANDRTFLPLRYVGLALGVQPDDILWDAKTQTATLFKGETVVQIQVGEMFINRMGAKITMDVAAFIHKDRVMVPLRALATAFGAQVQWEAETKAAKIIY